MKNKLPVLIMVLALIAGIHQVAAQGTRFFRISGPTAAAIIAFQPDGTMVWSNAQPGATYTVQTVSSLPGGTNWVDYVQLPATNGVLTNLLIDLNPPTGMALIPAGTFTMGNCMDTNEGSPIELPLHTVYISAFYMDKYDVTKALWDTVEQWAISHGYSFDNPGSGKGANHPVQMVRWYDMVKWCNARSEKEGRTPAYYTNAAQTAVYRAGRVDVDNSSVKWNAGYRLPTEAEWEKAARGGASGHRFPCGDTISWSQANYLTYSSGDAPYDVNPTPGFDPAFTAGGYPYTSPVDYFAPNGYGLHDMAGNVWQWCWDWYGAYPSDSQTDPRGPEPGSYRVLRGGLWNHNAIYCRTAYRDYGDPTTFWYWGLGFRSVLPPGQ